MKVTRTSEDSENLNMMQNVLVGTTTLLAALLLAACASTDGGSKLIHFPGAYRIDIQQGNVIKPDKVKQLRRGMTRQQVQYIMGTPLLADTFNKSRWDYVYWLQPGNGQPTRKRVVVLFTNDRLASVHSDIAFDDKAS